MITISPRRRRLCAASPAARMTAMISSTFGGLFDLRRIGRIPQTLVAWRVTGVESRHRRRRSTSTVPVAQKLGHDPSSGS
jgi:hypothetical protein